LLLFLPAGFGKPKFKKYWCVKLLMHIYDAYGAYVIYVSLLICPTLVIVKPYPPSRGFTQLDETTGNKSICN